MPLNVKWDLRFLALAEHVAQWSKDPTGKVGAVLVDPVTRIVVGMGYNGFPRGVVDADDRYNQRETKYQFVVHAEVNACMVAGDRASGAVLYVWPSFAFPPICSECAKVVIQAGVCEVVGYAPDETSPRYARWSQSAAISRMMLEEAGVMLRELPADLVAS